MQKVIRYILFGILTAAAIALLGGCATLSPEDSVLRPPTMIRVLLVANGGIPEEHALLRHLERFGVFESATLPDHQMTSAVDLAQFDVIVLTGFAADIPEQGLTHILESKKPVLVLDGQDFSLAQRLGLAQGVEATGEECDRLINVAPGIDRYSRFAGREVRFTRPMTAIASVADLSPGVLPLYSPATNPDRWTVFVDLERKIAVMGLSDTTRFSKSVWRLFDLLLDQIHPIGPRWEGYRQVAEGYVETGLSEYLDRAALDRRQETDRYRPEEVISETWITMVNWNLFELADHLSNRIEGVFPGNALLPRFPPISIPHPTCGGRGSRWFMGQDCTPSPHVPFWGEYIQGTDLGISARHNGKTFFYMGDTVPLLTDDKIGECDGGAICNDAIIGLAPWDTDPADGVDALPYVQPYYYFEQIPDGGIGINLGWTYRHQSIPGIHTNVWDPKFWNAKVGGITFDPVFTVPAAAVSVDLPYRSVPLPTMVLFYDTANAPEEIKHADPKVTPRSWAACSLDGLKFSNCYGSGVPFSEDRKGFPARFLQPVPVPITADELTAMCGQAGRRGFAPGNPLCASGLYDPASPVGGLLLFATGRYWSGLYVAYVRADELGKRDAKNRPVVHYLVKKSAGQMSWSKSESDATYIIPTAPNPYLDFCDIFLKSKVCPAALEILTEKGLVKPKDLPDVTEVFGVISVKKSYHGVARGALPYLVMLSAHFTKPSLHLRTVPLASFWNWSAPQPLQATGYGHHIIDQYSDYDPSGKGTLSLWFVSSQWDMKFPIKNYGVYTDHVDITPWPPLP